MAQRGLYFKFTYAMNENHVALEQEIPAMTFRPGRYFQGLDMYDASADLNNLFARIIISKELTFSTPNSPLFFLSHFSSAYTEKRVLGFARLSIKQDNRLISPPTPLDLMDYKVTQFQPLAVDFAPAMYFITIRAKQVV